MNRITSVNWEKAAKNLNGLGNQFCLELAQVLFDTVKALPDNALILEIGAYKGFSTCALAFACVGTGKRVMTIDTFIGNPTNTNLQDGENYYGEFLDNIKARDLQGYITPLIGRSEAFYAGWTFPLDLLFVDGDHRIMQEDLNAFFPHLKVGGILLMHDVYESHGTWQYVRELIDNARLIDNLGCGNKR